MPHIDPVFGPSDAAQQFAATLGCPSPTLGSNGQVEKVRREGHHEFEPRARRALVAHHVEWTRTTIAGVPCIEANPRKINCDRTILYCYGGGYVYGGAFDDLCISAALSGTARARIIAPEYRLAPEHPYPAAVDDGFAVYQELANTIPTEKFAIAGESAGGNLVLTLLLRAKDSRLPYPNSAALLSPWCDLTRVKHQQINTPNDPTLHPEDLDHYAEAYAGQSDRSSPYISPLFGEFNSNFPRTLITTGTRDVLFNQCLRLSRALVAADVTVDLRVWEGLWHVFECYDEIPEAGRSLKEISDFLF